MARSRRNYRSGNAKLTWYNQWFAKASAQITDTNQFNMFLGRWNLGTHIEHEATLERTRGSIVALSTQANTPFQLIVAGAVVDSKLAQNLTDLNTVNLLDSDEGDDYFLWETFACVNNVPNALNSREVDSKAKRRFEQGKDIVFYVSGRAVIPDGGSVQAANLFVGLNAR